MFYSNRWLWLGLLLVLLMACGSVPPETQPQVVKKSKATKKSSVENRYRRAIKLMQSGKTDTAIKMLQRLTVDFPKLSGPYANLGILYQKKNRLDEAEKVLRRAIGLNSSSALTHNQLGIVYRKTGKFQAARRQYKRAIKIDPNYSLAYLNLGILYDLYLADLDQAVKKYQQYQQLRSKKDKKVSRWIKDLQRRIKISDKKVSKNP